MKARDKLLLMLLDFADTFLHAANGTKKCKGYWPK